MLLRRHRERKPIVDIQSVANQPQAEIKKQEDNSKKKRKK